jgi:hypothetical protein
MRNIIDDLFEQKKLLARDLAGYIPINITSASNQFHASFPVGESYDGGKIAHNLAPPFDGIVFWSDAPPDGKAAGIGRYAVFMLATPHHIPTSPAKWELFFTVVAEFRGRAVQFSPWIVIDVNADGTTPSLVYVDGKAGWMAGSIDNDGSVPSLPKIPIFDLRVVMGLGGPEQNAFLLDWFIAPCLFAISLTHTKNVSIERMPRLTPHSRKIKKRRADLPLIDHHQIVIRDRQGRVVDANSLRTDHKNGMHVVRGHFSTYTKEAPLFGKVTGTFWVPAHIRGLESERVITSEYVV